VKSEKLKTAIHFSLFTIFMIIALGSDRAAKIMAVRAAVARIA